MSECFSTESRVKLRFFVSALTFLPLRFYILPFVTSFSHAPELAAAIVSRDIAKVRTDSKYGNGGHCAEVETLTNILLIFPLEIATSLMTSQVFSMTCHCKQCQSLGCHARKEISN